LSDKNLAKLKEDVISDEKVEVDIINCYASSNYNIRYVRHHRVHYDSHGLPCKSGELYSRKFDQTWYSGILYGQRRTELVTF